MTSRETLEKIKENIKQDTAIVSEIVDSIVNKYCRELDALLDEITRELDAHQLSDVQLDMYCIKIPVLLYFTSARQEDVGLLEDISEMARQEVYSKAYQEAHGTIGDKENQAEILSQSEDIIHTAYSRAYKKIKARAEYASNIMDALKKVMTRRMSEIELSRRSITNEVR